MTSTTLRELPPTLSIEEASELLGISRRSAYRAASNGQLPTFRMGKRMRVPTAKLLDILGLATEHATVPEHKEAS